MSSLLVSLGSAAWMPGVARHAPVARHAAATMNWVDGSNERGKGQHWLVDVTPASENLLEGPAPELTPRDVVEAQCDAMKRADVEHFWKFVAPDGEVAVDDFTIRVICDPKSYLYLNGTEIDFKDEIMGRGFVFNNPNANNTCGCGSSFSA